MNFGILRNAQIRYNTLHPGSYLSGGCYAVDLDVSIDTPKYFNLNITCLSKPSMAPHGVLVGTTRLPNNTYGQYFLAINEAGEIYCSGGTGGICEKLGYPPL